MSTHFFIGYGLRISHLIQHLYVRIYTLIMIAITFIFVVGGRCEYSYACIRNGFLEICCMAVFELSFSSFRYHVVFY